MIVLALIFGLVLGFTLAIDPLGKIMLEKKYTEELANLVNEIYEIDKTNFDI